MIDSRCMLHLCGFGLPLAILYLERLLESRLNNMKAFGYQIAMRHLACRFIDAFKHTLLLIPDHFADAQV